jgi:BirA family biotin operon repressor/biotin-[acetyl-CoA-carboxylase] ligase
MSQNDDSAGTPSWLLKRVAETASTNDLARSLAPWQAVAAVSQNAGRGRHRRKFCCDPGGIWLSAVVPMPGGPQRWTGLALAVGWGLLHWLKALPGLRPEARLGARLRWPNDLMIHRQKLGGILLEQNERENCIVGVGINVANDPALQSPDLAGTTTKLADWLPECPAVDKLLPGVLEGIARGWVEMEKGGLAGLAGDLNESWGAPLAVEIFPVDGGPVTGALCGINEEGAVVIRLPDGGGRSFPAHQVERMIELG